MDEVKRGKVTANLSISSLHPHPKNPRKNLGDLKELTESIKKNGIMQNLTVVPGFYKQNGDWFNTETEYTVIIGHRRLEAAKAAGLTEVPCRIYKNLPESEQITTMLEENMQRNDLTPIEQADSFQLCLDLGETVDTLSEKTGFAKSTIYHRLNIAKLDKKIIKETEANHFQLTINDFIELEKVKDIDERNRILKDARSSNEIRFQADQAAKNEKRKALETEAKEMLEERGLSEGETSDRWSGKYETIYRHSLAENDYTNNFTIPEEIDFQIDEGAKYLISYGDVTILNPKRDDSEDEDEKEESTYDKEYREREERKEKYRAVRESLKTETTDFVRAIVEEKLKNPSKEELVDITEGLFSLYLFMDSKWSDKDTIIEFLDESVDTRDEETDEYKAAHDRALALPAYKKLLILMAEEVNRDEPMNYTGFYIAENAECMMRFYYVLERWDWNTQKEEMELMNGTAEYYKHEDEEDE